MMTFPHVSPITTFNRKKRRKKKLLQSILSPSSLSSCSPLLFFSSFSSLHTPMTTQVSLPLYSSSSSSSPLASRVILKQMLLDASPPTYLFFLFSQYNLIPLFSSLLPLSLSPLSLSYHTQHTRRSPCVTIPLLFPFSSSPPHRPLSLHLLSSFYNI